ncbi:hypothetical protein WOLCODRAFT_78351, partial [Wolfiporia cocos MD-104 SS10]
LKKWVRFHKSTLMGATIHALRLPEDLSRARTHVLLIKLQLHGDQNGALRKHAELSVVSVAEAIRWPKPWPWSLKTLRDMQNGGERRGHGTTAACLIECYPFSVQTVPFGSLTEWKDASVEPRWEVTLRAYTNTSMRFRAPPCFCKDC